MKASIRSSIVALVLMTAAAFSTSALTPRNKLPEQLGKLVLDTAIPAAFGNWKLDESVPAPIVNPQQQAFLNTIYTQTLSRTYVNGQGQRIMLSVAYGEDQSDQTSVHLPDVCYPAQGFTLVGAAIDRLDIGTGGVTVRRLVARTGQRNEPLTYWLVVGERPVLGGTKRKLAQLEYGFKGIIPDGLIFRVSSISPDAKAAFALQDEFVRSLAHAMPPATRNRILGNPELAIN